MEAVAEDRHVGEDRGELILAAGVDRFGEFAVGDRCDQGPGAAGLAGERFGVRNSGAVAVVEGMGATGLEYMTGGRAVVLGPVGFNFAAGMTGGMAFVLDRHDRFTGQANPESIVWQRIDSAYWEDRLKGLIAAHIEGTDSQWAQEILRNWDRYLPQFWQVCPKEMLTRLAHPLSDAVAMEAAE